MKCQWAKDHMGECTNEISLEARVKALEEMVIQDRRDSYEFFKKLSGLINVELSDKRGK